MGQGDRPPGSGSGTPPSAAYTTLGGTGQGAYETKRSRFLGLAARVGSEGEAAALIKARRREFPDATHHVFAYRLGRDAVARYSDDGEPTGSSGLPTLEAIRRLGVTDAAVVVTRYFGGVLLGVGGLARAYAHTAVLSMTDAGVVTYERYVEMRVEAGYADYQRIAAELPAFGVLIDGREFASRVTLRIAARAEVVPALEARLSELTGGRCRTEATGERFDRAPS